MASVVPCKDDPSKYGVVICNPDGTPIGLGSSVTPGGLSHQVQINSSGTLGGITNGLAGTVLMGNGAAADPTFQNLGGEYISSSAVGSLDNLALDYTKRIHFVNFTGATDIQLTGTAAGNALDGDRLIFFAQSLGNLYLLYNIVASGIPFLVIPSQVIPGLPVIGQWQGRAEFIYFASINRWILQHYEMGASLNIPYNSANFGAQAGIWTHPSNGYYYFNYYIAGRRVYISGNLGLGSLSANTNYLTINNLPFTFGNQEWMAGSGQPTPVNPKLAPVMVGTPATAGSTLQIYPADFAISTTFSANASQTSLIFTGSYLIN